MGGRQENRDVEGPTPVTLGAKKIESLCQRMWLFFFSTRPLSALLECIMTALAAVKIHWVMSQVVAINFIWIRSQHSSDHDTHSFLRVLLRMWVRNESIR